MSAEEWYVKVKGEGVGPISSPQLRKLSSDGTVHRSTLIRKGEDGRWIAAGKVKGLFIPLDRAPGSVNAPSAPAEANSEEPEYYYSTDGRREGPVSLTQLETLAKSGAIRPDDLLWKRGMSNWEPVSGELKGLISEPSLPPPQKVARPHNPIRPMHFIAKLILALCAAIALAVCGFIAVVIALFFVYLLTPGAQ